MRAQLFTISTVIWIAALSGCGGTETGPSAATTSGSTPAAQTTSSDVLEASVRTSLRAYHRLSVRSLWSNSVASHPVAISGPALVDLRNAVAQRRNRGIRVRLLSDRFHLVSIHLDPSFATATAVVADPQRVQPFSYDGRPLGRAVMLNERAHIELHRVNRGVHFVVWKVSPTK